jgi:N-carbamoyl-L-amino-acid hydrolase
MFQVKPDRAIADLRRLAEFGKVDSGVNRRALTPEDIEARAWLLARMQDAGLEARIDGIGNVIGRTPDACKHIIIGSHTDSVPNGGWLDGAMGVIFGLEIARAYNEARPDTEVGLEIISFNDEEGRFVGLLGSGTFCRVHDPQQIVAVRDVDGISLMEALAAAGYAGSEPAKFNPTAHIAYLEAHIEQGPVLEEAGVKIGVVNEIVGVARAQVSFLGMADHAGTTPMAMRKDAAAALYDFAVQYAQFCERSGGPMTVWNLGNVRLDPGVYNVVTRRADLYVEYRDGSLVVLERIREYVRESAARIAAKHRVESKLIEGIQTPPVAMDPRLCERIQTAADTVGASYMCMPSGAGHDAMLFAERLPTGMLFVPSIGGRSHDIVEDTDEADIALGLEVLATVVGDIVQHGL